MMLSGRNILLVLLMLWLPLQGALAAVMPLCAHEKNAGALLDTPVTATSNDQRHDACHDQSMNGATDNNAASSLPCDNCAPCHSCCNAPIPSAFSTAIPGGDSSYAASLNSRFTQFVPEQPQRPPLV